METPKVLDEKASVHGVEHQAGLDLSTFRNGEFDGIVIPPRGSAERKRLENRLKWKIDLTILPIVFCMYILNYLDRNNIAAAKLGTFMEDLGLTATQYSTCVSILFVGYISMQIPSNLILEKVGHPSIYLPTAMAFWGVVSACTGAVQGFGGMVVVRLLIGFLEAAFYPGVLFYLSCWYTRQEIAARTAIFVGGSWISGAFSGFIAYGVMKNLEGAHGIAAWRWLFIIEGAATIGFALLAIPILPDLPGTTRWLSKEERLLGIIRMIEDVGARDEDLHAFGAAFVGVKLAAKDPKVVNLFIMMFCFSATAGINTVFPTIVNSLGYDREKTLLLTAPPWVLCTITSVLNSLHSDYTGERYKHMLWGPTLALIGFVIGISSTAKAPRYVAMMLLLQVYNSWALGFAWLTNTIPRPPVKRAAASACVNVGGNIPNIFVPYFFSYTGATPHFYVGFAICICFALFGLLAATTLKIQLSRLNKKLENGEKVDGLSGESFKFL
ncbi:pantothenate transporter liz1, partial [Myxozyma melibiosi]